jgi:N-acetylglutamate synthase-like GNAT family acetyltransferase
MRADEVGAADRVTRLAFGTKFGLEDPLQAFGDSAYVRPRFLAQPEGSLVARRGDDLVGLAQVTRWGCFAFLGPVAVDPAAWDLRVGRRLVAAAMEIVDGWGVEACALFTFADSPKHLALYQGAGFWPQRPTVLTSRPTSPGGAVAASRLTSSSDPESLLERARALAHSVMPGYDPTPELRAVIAQSLGEALIVERDGRAVALAAVHLGAGEATSEVAFVKVAVAAPGEPAGEHLGALLDSVEALAAERGLARVTVGVNTARTDAYRHLLSRGYRVEGLGLSMVRPDVAALNRPDALVLDDLR